MNDTSDLAKRENIIKWVKLGGTGLALGLVLVIFSVAALVTASAVTAGCIAVITGLAAVNTLPVAAMKIANWRLGAMKAEARKNPIETAENQLLEMNKRLDAYKANTQEFIAEGMALITDVNEMRKGDPEGAAEYDDEIKNFYIQKDLREGAIVQAVNEIEEARIRIEKASRRWKLAQKHKKFLTPTEASAALDKILLDEALNAVMSAAFATTSKMQVDAMADKARADFKQSRTASAVEYRKNNPPMVTDGSSGIMGNANNKILTVTAVEVKKD